MAEAADFADGTVHALTGGAEQLCPMLAAAAARRQVLVVDFSAVWCGPCKMMVPVLERLAAELRGRAVVCKVDCEETPANRDLAREAGISAFPTFHVYRAGAKVAELRGANPAGLQAAIREQLGLLEAATGPMAAALTQALQRLQRACASREDFLAATRTLLVFASNVLAHPEDPKYRRVRLANPAYQAKLGSKDGARECMAALGFQEREEEGEAVFVMDAVPAELATVTTLLQRAVPGGQIAERADPAALARMLAAAMAAGPQGAARGPAGAAGPAAAGPAPAAPPAAAGGQVAQASGGSGRQAAAAVPAPPAAGPGPGGAGAGGAHGAAPAGAGGAGAGGAHGAAPAGAGGAGAGGPHRRAPRRRLVITVEGMARVLERLLLEAGLGGGAAGGQGQGQGQGQ